MSTVKSGKATPDYRVTFACSECMFSTTSGISAQAHRDWHKQEDKLYQELENRVVKLGIQESIAALNSCHPERDQLVWELADAVLLQHSPAGGIYGRAHDCIMSEQARQLLKLYEEVAP